MKILSIEFRNILCFGNKTVKIDYENLGNGSLNIVMGKNGCGKSSFIKLHKLALYFESDGVTMDGIANEINGNGYLAIEVLSNNHKWRIESEYTRTKLNSLNVFKDGNTEAEDWGKIPETKKMINQQIIDIPYHIFSNILSLSINDFKSFLSMNPKDTRNIRDRIFGFYILNEMNEILKKNIKAFNDSHIDNRSKLANITEIINNTAIKIEEEKKKQEENSKEKKENLEKEIQRLNQELANNLSFIETRENKISQLGLYSEKIVNEEIKSTINALEKSIEDLEKQQLEDNRTYQQLEEFLNNLKADKETYNNKQKLNSYKLAVKKSEEFLKQLKEKKEEYNKLGENLSEISKKYDQLIATKEWNQMINDVYGKLVDTDIIYHSLLSSQSSLATQKEAKEAQQKIIDNANETISKLQKENDDLLKENNLYKEKKCPTCGNNFESAEFIKKIEDNEIKIENNNQIIENNKELKNSAKEELINNIIPEIEKFEKNVKADEQSYLLTYNNAKMRFTQFKQNVTEDFANNYMSLEEFFNDKLEKEFNNNSEDRAFGEIIKDFDTKWRKEYDEEEIKKVEEEKQATSKIVSEKQSELNKVASDYNSYQSIVKSHNEEEIKKIEELHYKIQEINDDMIEEIERQIFEKDKEVKSQTEKISNIKSNINVTKERIKNYKSKIKGDSYFENLEIVEDLTDEQISKFIEDERKEIEITENAIKDINQSISQQTIELKSIEEIAKSNVKQLEELQEEYKSKLADLEKEEKKINININFLRIIEYTLSDEGIKSFIIKKIVPAINKNISEILSQLEIPLIVKFDNEFKPTIYRYGKAVSTNSISTGQTKMIDSAITFTITRFLLSKCNGINIIFYDEIFSSLHTTAVTTMMEIISNELVKKLGLHVFLVNHSFISSTFFDNVFEFYFKDHFSNISIKTVEEYNEEQL